jgi:hypothetical protein
MVQSVQKNNMVSWCTNTRISSKQQEGTIDVSAMGFVVKNEIQKNHGKD